MIVRGLRLAACGVAFAIGIAGPAAAARDAGAGAGTGVRAGAPQATAAAGAPAVLRASFVQERRIAGFRHPLRSEGEVLLVRGEGLRWHTRAPFASTLIVRDGRMWLRDADGRRQDISEGGHVAALVQELLGALLSGDRAALATRFTVSEAAAPREGAWAIALVPKGEPLASLYDRIDILGSAHVERLTLQERGGASTTIRFDDTQVQAQASDAERHALD